MVDIAGIAELAACAPKLRTLVVRLNPFRADLGALRHQNLRRLQLLSWPDGLFGDDFIAILLSAFPRLAILHIGLLREPATSVSFGGDALARVICCPAMRELNVAHQWGIRKEGLENIVRLFPNLRALDIRGCSLLNLNDFTAVMLKERPPPEAAAAPAASASAPNTAPITAADATAGDVYPPHHQRLLRLRKLRRVAASYLVPMPEALDFVEYECAVEDFSDAE
jgi:hypothetical protein